MKSSQTLNSEQRAFLQISIKRNQKEDNCNCDYDGRDNLKSYKSSEQCEDQSPQSFKSGSGSLSDILFSPHELRKLQDSDKENVNVGNFKMQSAREELSFAKKPFKDQVFGNERQINTAEMKKFLLQPDESYGSE